MENTEGGVRMNQDNQTTNTDRYTRVLQRDHEGDVVATIRELRGCMAHGATEAEALTNLAEAQAMWMRSAQEAGLPIPPPASSGEGERLEHLIAFCEQTARDGIMPSLAWFAETADALRALRSFAWTPGN